MARINRIRVTWTGFAGAPGVSTFYSLDPVGTVAQLNATLDALRVVLPTDVTLTTPSTGDIIEATDGTLAGTWVGATSAAHTGTQAGTYAAPVGAVLEWITGSVMDGHRVKGKTFVVPLSGVAFNLIGSIEASNLTLLTTLAAGFVVSAAPNFVIWHRPFAGRAAIGTRPARPAHPGAFALVTASRVPNEAIVLRSRRD